MSITKQITATALFAALMAVLAQLQLPSMPPVTLQTFVLFLSVGMLGTRGATAATAVYLSLGAIGLPVFSGLRGGVSVFAEATGGYLAGFLFTALVSGIIIDRFGRKTSVMAAAFAIGIAVCYIFGSVWYYIFYIGKSGAIGIGAVLLQCVLPFIPFDAIKAALAIFVTKRLRKAFAGI